MEAIGSTDRLLVMEASRVATPAVNPLDDPVELATHREALRALVVMLEANMTPEQRAEADEMYAQLVARAEHWPE